MSLSVRRVFTRPVVVSRWFRSCPETPKTPDPARLITVHEDPTDNPEDWRRRYYEVAAQLSNERKVIERRLAAEREMIERKLAKGFLPVLDQLAQLPENPPAEMCLTAMEKQLDALGVKRMLVNEGDRFDPKFHEAVLERGGSGTQSVIAEVVSPGFFLRDQILRPARVVTKKND